jgi:hypothetical protein
MFLGLLYKAKKKRALAVQHLTEANRIVSQFGAPMLARIEAALAQVASSLVKTGDAPSIQSAGRVHKRVAGSPRHPSWLAALVSVRFEGVAIIG